MSRFSFLRFGLLSSLLVGGAAMGADLLQLHTRARQRVAPDSQDYQVVERLVQCDPSKTAIIICDMWDKHWCKGATARVAEMAPRMNQVIKEARRRGVLIIHAPSETMGFYADCPQRKRAQQAPKAQSPVDPDKWRALSAAKEGPLPIDDSDGGCDDQPQCAQGNPWRRQIAVLEIMPEDVISDRGDEVFNVLQQLGIENVIIMGVHTNMCVLGRSFAIRQMVGLGKNVLLMRDLTDTMYNSRRRPYVSHFAGTDLVIEHIEKHWCPTITSADFLGGEPFRFKDDVRPRVVFLIGEPEYNTKTTLPEFAQKELAWRGLRCTVVQVSDKDPNDFAGLEAVGSADLLFVSVRRRAPLKAQMEFIRNHLSAGKPLIGIRTASHAFDTKAPDDRHATWNHFDLEVLGANYQGHYNNTPSGGRPTLVAILPEAAKHPILTGLRPEGFQSTATLYRSRNLAPSVTPLLTGSIQGGQEREPVAWVNTAQGRRVFYTSLGGPEDFQLPAFRRLLLNAVLWALKRPIPPVQ